MERVDFTQTTKDKILSALFVLAIFIILFWLEFGDIPFLDDYQDTAYLDANSPTIYADKNHPTFFKKNMQIASTEQLFTSNNTFFILTVKNTSPHYPLWYELCFFRGRFDPKDYGEAAFEEGILKPGESVQRKIPGREVTAWISKSPYRDKVSGSCYDGCSINIKSEKGKGAGVAHIERRKITE